jgi:tetratricopeptide (TPR) repeat protein
MAGKRTLNAKNLQTLGAAALAELLIEVSAGNALIQRRLRLALAAAGGAEGAAQEVRKRLSSIARSTTFIDSAKRKALLADLEAQQQAITGPIATADPALAVELQVRLLELSEGVLDRSSDSTGAVIGLFQRGVDTLATLAAAAASKPQELVEHAAELLQENGYGQFERLIPALAPALGEAGLLQLEEALLERGGVDRYTMEQLVRGRGDLDGYLELFEPSQLTWPDTAAEVAGHLLRGGRAEQALAVLDRAAKSSQIIEAEAWHATRIAVLEALGRSEEAQQHRWQVFRHTLSIPVLREYLQRLDDFADVEAEEQALAVVEQHPLPLAALQFLVFWPSLPRAARYVIEHCHHWDGDAYEIYEPAAERLSADHPVAASLLLRAMAVFALSMGRSKRYRYAAEHLRQCEQLEARIDDWQGFESHNSFMGRLREAFAQKWSFWQQLER